MWCRSAVNRSFLSFLLLDVPAPAHWAQRSGSVSGLRFAVAGSLWSNLFPPPPPPLVSQSCSGISQVSGRRRRAFALASVRRSNCTYTFRVCSFHEDSLLSRRNGGN